MEKQKIYSVQLPESLVNNLKELAQANNLNFSNMVRFILTDYIKRAKKEDANS